MDSTQHYIHWVATYPKHGNTTNDPVHAAEFALKHAKEEGKDRVVLAGE